MRATKRLKDTLARRTRPHTTRRTAQQDAHTAHTTAPADTTARPASQQPSGALSAATMHMRGSTQAPRRIAHCSPPGGGRAAPRAARGRASQAGYASEKAFGAELHTALLERRGAMPRWFKLGLG